MEVTQSPPMTWEDWVQEEEERERHSSTGGDSQPDLSSPPLEGCDVSDISMAEEGPQQHISDVIVEGEESMETDAPLDSAAPALLPEKPCRKTLRLRLRKTATAKCQRKAQTRTHPMTLIPMRMSFWGHQLTFLFPGDTLMTLLPSSFPREMMTYKCCSCTMRLTTSTTTPGLKPTGLGLFEPTSPASRNRSNFDFVCSLCINHVFCLNKTATMRLCWRAWGRVSCAAHCPF